MPLPLPASRHKRICKAWQKGRGDASGTTATTGAGAQDAEAYPLENTARWKANANQMQMALEDRARASKRAGIFFRVGCFS